MDTLFPKKNFFIILIPFTLSMFAKKLAGQDVSKKKDLPNLDLDL